MGCDGCGSLTKGSFLSQKEAKAGAFVHWTVSDAYRENRFDCPRCQARLDIGHHAGLKDAEINGMQVMEAWEPPTGEELRLPPGPQRQVGVGPPPPPTGPPTAEVNLPPGPPPVPRPSRRQLTAADLKVWDTPELTELMKMVADELSQRFAAAARRETELKAAAGHDIIFTSEDGHVLAIADTKEASRVRLQRPG